VDIKASFATNPALELNGAWVDIGDGSSVLVARNGNKNSRALSKQLVAPHKVALRNDKLPDDVLEKITIQVMAQTILLDWKGIDEAGQPVPYTVENARRLLTDYPDFRDQVSGIASDMRNYQDQEEAEAAKNFSTASSGT